MEPSSVVSFFPWGVWAPMHTGQETMEQILKWVGHQDPGQGVNGVGVSKDFSVATLLDDNQ